MSDSGGDTVRRNSMLVKTVRVKFDNRLQRSSLQFRVFNQLADTFSLSPQLSPVDNVHDFFPRPVLQIAKDKMSLTLPGWENIKVRLPTWLFFRSRLFRVHFNVLCGYETNMK